MSVVSNDLPFAHGKVGEVGNATMPFLPLSQHLRGRSAPRGFACSTPLGPAGDALTSPQKHSHSSRSLPKSSCPTTLDYNNSQDCGHYFSKSFLLKLEASV